MYIFISRDLIDKDSINKKIFRQFYKYKNNNTLDTYSLFLLFAASVLSIMLQVAGHAGIVFSNFRFNFYSTLQLFALLLTWTTICAAQ